MPSQKHSKTHAFPRFWQSFLVLEGRKIKKLQQLIAERAEDTFQMRLGELRRLQTRQNGGSGLPRELPRLSPRVTMDIGGTAFGRPRGGSYPNLDETWSPKQTQLEIVCRAKNIAKPMRFLGFGSLFWFWRVGRSRNCSKRLLNELKTRSKCCLLYTSPSPRDRG